MSNLELKRILIEGVSTLYVIDSNNSEKARQLVQSMDTIPEVVTISALMPLGIIIIFFYAAIKANSVILFFKHLRYQIAQQKSVQTAFTKSQWKLALIPLMDY